MAEDGLAYAVFPESVLLKRRQKELEERGGRENSTAATDRQWRKFTVSRAVACRCRSLPLASQSH